MATLLDVLKVRIEADPSSLKQGMDQAAKTVEASAKRMNSSLATVSATFKTLLAASSVAALLNFSKRTIDAIGGLGELADQLGVSTTALQAYQFAATQVGLSQDQLQQGLTILTRKIGEAAEGGNDAIASFRSLGIGVLDLQGNVRTTEDILGDIAEAIKNAKSPAEQASIAFEKFGRAGQKLIPFLKEGRAGLADLTDAARRAGVIVDDALIKRFDEASDKMSQWKMQITVKFAEGLDAMLSKLQDPKYQVLLAILGGAGAGAYAGGLPGAAVGAAGGLGTFLAMSGGQSLDQQLAALDKQIASIESTGDDFFGRVFNALGVNDPNKRKLEDLKALRDGIASALEEGNRALGGLTAHRGTAGASTSGVDPASKEYAQLISTLETARDSIDQTTASQLRLRMERELDSKGMPKWNSLQIEAAVAIQQQTDAAKARVDLFKQELAAQQQVTQAEKDATDAQKQANAEIWEQLYIIEFRELPAQRKLLEALKNGNLAYEEEAEFLKIISGWKAKNVEIDEKAIALARKLAKEQVEVNRNTERQKAANDELERFADQSFDRIGEAMTRAAVEGKDAWKDWRDVAKGVISEIMQELFKLSVLNPLKNLIFGEGKGKNPTIEDVFGGMKLPNPSGDEGGFGFLSGLASSFGGLFAEGGRPPVGVPSIVGEKGAELFVPDVPGRIVPNSQLGSMGGQTINIYPDLRGASADAVEALHRMVRNLNASVEPRAVRAVSDARQRGLVPA